MLSRPMPPDVKFEYECLVNQLKDASAQINAIWQLPANKDRPLADILPEMQMLIKWAEHLSTHIVEIEKRYPWQDIEPVKLSWFARWRKKIFG